MSVPPTPADHAATVRAGLPRPHGSDGPYECACRDCTARYAMDSALDALERKAARADELERTCEKAIRERRSLEVKEDDWHTAYERAEARADELERKLERLAEVESTWELLQALDAERERVKQLERKLAEALCAAERGRADELERDLEAARRNVTRDAQELFDRWDEMNALRMAAEARADELAGQITSLTLSANVLAAQSERDHQRAERAEAALRERDTLIARQLTPLDVAVTHIQIIRRKGDDYTAQERDNVAAIVETHVVESRQALFAALGEQP